MRPSMHSYVLIPSAARTTTFNSDEQNNRYYRGVRLFLDITAVSGTPTLDLQVEVKDPISGAFVDLPGAAFPQQSIVSKAELVIYPGIAETANVSVSDCLDRIWRLAAVIAGGTPSLTFSVGATLIE